MLNKHKTRHRHTLALAAFAFGKQNSFVSVFIYPNLPLGKGIFPCFFFYPSSKQQESRVARWIYFG